MKMPPDYFQPFMYTVEVTVIQLWDEFRSLNDKDVEYAYDKLRTYYKQKSQGKSPEEPECTSERRQALIDELLNAIEVREEEEADISYINHPDCMPGGRLIHSLPALYTMCFTRLIKSVQMWRKEMGAQGYLKFIKGNVI